MHEIHLFHQDKALRYQELLPQIRSLIEDETDMTANLANVSAALNFRLFLGRFLYGKTFRSCR